VCKTRLLALLGVAQDLDRVRLVRNRSRTQGVWDDVVLCEIGPPCRVEPARRNAVRALIG